MGSSIKRYGSLATAILVVSLLGVGTGASNFDAGTSADAGNTRSAALNLAGFGSYNGYLASNDVDWYRLAANHSSPVCISATGTGDSVQAIGLTVTSAYAERAVTTKYAPGALGRLAIAAPSLKEVHYDVSTTVLGSAGQGAYTFTLERTPLPSASAGDALSGTDASDNLTSALTVSVPCFGGHLSVLSTVIDARDIFALTAAEPGVLLYSLSTAGDVQPITLTVRNASGAAMGTTLTSAGLATVEVPAAGSYYLEVSRQGGSVSEMGYMVGAVFGPPSSTCRPQC